MAFDPNTRTFDSERPVWLCRYTAMNSSLPFTGRHHRIGWTLLKDNVLNPVVSGHVEFKVIRNLMRFSNIPDPKSRLTAYERAVWQAACGKTLPPTQIRDLQDMATELFQLPFNVFHGPSRRADDPSCPALAPNRNIDFLPADVDSDGVSLSPLEDSREKLYGLLHASPIDEKNIGEICKAIAARLGAELYAHTPYSASDWFPFHGDPQTPRRRYEPPVRRAHADPIAHIWFLTERVAKRGLRMAA